MKKQHERKYANGTPVIIPVRYFDGIHNEPRIIVEFHPVSGNYELLDTETGRIGFRPESRFTVVE